MEIELSAPLLQDGRTQNPRLTESQNHNTRVIQLCLALGRLSEKTTGVSDIAHTQGWNKGPGTNTAHPLSPGR
eukprot:7217985-Pyramimonas_sp.AAC.1